MAKVAYLTEDKEVKVLLKDSSPLPADAIDYDQVIILFFLAAINSALNTLFSVHILQFSVCTCFWLKKTAYIFVEAKKRSCLYC